MGYVPKNRGHTPFLFGNQLNIITMIPPLKQILLFFTLNFLITTFFNILLFKISDFLTYESFNTFLMLNSHKIGMLVSVFILTAFMLNLLFSGVFFKNGFKRSLLNTIRMSMGTFLAGIMFMVVVMFVNEIK